MSEVQIKKEKIFCKYFWNPIYIKKKLLILMKILVQNRLKES